MRRFSLRRGLKPSKVDIQSDFMDDDLKNSLWNALTMHYWSKMSMGIPLYANREIHLLFQNIWSEHFKQPIDTIPHKPYDALELIRKLFYGFQWYEVYDLIEFIANSYEDDDVNQNFMEDCNNILTRELSAFRFVGGFLTEITSEQEIAEVEKALHVPLDPVKEHLECALKLMSNKKKPEYRNSIKESISAVEAACKRISGSKKAGLSDALNSIEREGKVKLHPVLKSAFEKLYGYTSSDTGIRHALVDESNFDSEDAKFMLISCSAFINYLVVKASKAGVL